MKRKVYMLIGLSFCLGIIASYTFFSDGSSDATTPLETFEEEDTSEQMKEINGLRVTLNHARTEPTDANDSQIVIVDVTINNERDEVIEFSNYKMTLIDDNDYAHNHSSDIDTKGILGGQIHPGRSNRGEIAFKVPRGTNYELVYTDHLRTGQLIWDINPSKSMKGQLDEKTRG